MSSQKFCLIRKYRSGHKTLLKKLAQQLCFFIQVPACTPLIVQTLANSIGCLTHKMHQSKKSLSTQNIEFVTADIKHTNNDVMPNPHCKPVP